MSDIDSDFIQSRNDKNTLAELTKALFDTTVGKLRKAHLRPKQAVALARAWAFADMNNVPELAQLADMLADTTVSIDGRGLKQMVTVMSARMTDDKDDEDSMRRLGRNLGV